MSVKMRLRRMGAKHRPSYRIVIMPALAPRDGSYLDQVGFYDPLTNPATVRIDRDKAVDWLRKGAQPTDTVARLLGKLDIDHSAIRRRELLIASRSAKAATVAEVIAADEAPAPAPSKGAEREPAAAEVAEAASEEAITSETAEPEGEAEAAPAPDAAITSETPEPEAEVATASLPKSSAAEAAVETEAAGAQDEETSAAESSEPGAETSENAEPKASQDEPAPSESEEG